MFRYKNNFGMTIPLGREICLRFIVESTLNFIHVEFKSPRFTHTCEDEASNSYIGSKWQFHFCFWLWGVCVTQNWWCNCANMMCATSYGQNLRITNISFLRLYNINLLSTRYIYCFFIKEIFIVKYTHSVLLQYISFLYFYLS